MIEKYERLEEISRSDAFDTIDSFSYKLSLHLMKLYYYPNNTAYNHWIVEVRNFINSIIKRTRKVKIKRGAIYQSLSQDVLSIQIRREFVNNLHENYGYVIIDMDDMYNSLNCMLEEISKYIDLGNIIDYNTVEYIVNRC